MYANDPEMAKKWAKEEAIREKLRYVLRQEIKSVNELKKMTPIQKIEKLAKANKYGEVDGMRMNGKTANTIMKVYNHPKIKQFHRKLDSFKSNEIIDVLLNLTKVLGIKEDRDYKAEYKKYGSSTKSKKYRAELNQYNRKKGTYGNNDGKDASHKGGKIVGFEKESTNRGRREKSRLKKEDIREFSGDQGINVYLGGIVNSLQKAGIKAKTAKQMKHGFSKSRDKIGFFIDVLDRKREKYTLQLEIDRDGNLWYLSASKDMKLGKWADTSKVVRSLKAISKLPDFGQSSLKRR